MPNQNAALSLLALKKIVEGTSTFTGKEFFQMLVKNLAETLDLHGVWVTEYDAKENYLHSLAFWLKDDFVPKYDYCVIGTPCEPVIASNDIFHVPERVIELFPNDPDLPPLGAVSYVGLALKDEKGEVLGHLAALDNKPVPELPEFFAIFKLFASRAEAELRRLQYERRLIENEAKLSRLVNGAMNGIFEMDEKLNITQVNPAAVKLFGVKNTDNLIGTSVKNLLSVKGFKKLLEIIPFLNENVENLTALWIPGYVECLKKSGEYFHAEASLSKFVVHGETFYVFFIANVQDRLTAEQQVEKLQSETALLREEIRVLQNPGAMVGNSPGIQKVCELIRQVAPTDTTVLITGETGTGKELLARAIHESSGRKDKTMITVNCAALPPELIESELFGHIKGAFTGALTSREGRFVLADQATLFLDEIGEMPLSLQSKLLRVLQEGEVQPIGSSKTIKVDVRIIAATNRDLSEEVRKGNFREDLYYRLNVFPIHLPPLRERGKDIIEIAEAFIAKHARKLNKKVVHLDDIIQHQLLSYPWPGNIRELQNIIERALIMSKDGKLELPPLFNSNQSNIEKLSSIVPKIYTVEELRILERQNILRALQLANWKVSGAQGAAALLDIPATTLNSKIKALGITKNDEIQ
ncbi:MAG: sigma 54-interacting transcriptional regulator [Saprospiraceae bacterium]|nr:sigma 54-interacting transcriptional regulator [Saprospiraceae bacterium]